MTRWTPKDPAAARIIRSLFGTTLQWRHNERDGVSNHRCLDCILNRLFRRRSKKTSKLHVTVCVRGIHRWPVNSPQSPVNSSHKSQWRGTCFHDLIMKTGNIDVGDEWSYIKCEVSSPPKKCILMNKINSHRKEFGREPSSPDPPLLILGECPHRGDTSSPPPHPHPTKKKRIQGVHLINAL